MSLNDEYKRQFEWRDWQRVLDALPPVDGHTVLDLGCAVGDLAAGLTARGARVIGFDMDEDLLREARSRQLANAEFRTGDLRHPPELDDRVDGVWCSFTAAYLPDLPPVLTSWAKRLRPGGWIALIDIDDLFGHQPLGRETHDLLEGYIEHALEAGWYDFRMGRKLEAHLERSGFAISRVMTLEDRELSFEGPASADVSSAWRSRFERMNALRRYCGSKIEQVEADFLACLERADHRSTAKVYCCLATTPL